jgi:hypothetical protein
MIKNIALGLGAVLIIIQFFQIDKNQPPVDPNLDFISLEKPQMEVENLLRSACYDCHSYESEYPWYTNIQPVAWMIDHHIDHSQEYLNFSEWGNYSLSRADHKAEEVIEYTENGEMPLWSYRLMHKEAQLTDDQRQVIMDYFTDLRVQIQAKQVDANGGNSTPDANDANATSESD